MAVRRMLVHGVIDPGIRRRDPRATQGANADGVRHDLVDGASRHDVAGEEDLGMHAKHLLSRGAMRLRYGDKGPSKKGGPRTYADWRERKAG